MGLLLQSRREGEPSGLPGAQALTGLVDSPGKRAKDPGARVGAAREMWGRETMSAPWSVRALAFARNVSL